jgi:hypothetical protein
MQFGDVAMPEQLPIPQRPYRYMPRCCRAALMLRPRRGTSRNTRADCAAQIWIRGARIGTPTYGRLSLHLEWPRVQSSLVS